MKILFIVKLVMVISIDPYKKENSEFPYTGEFYFGFKYYVSDIGVFQ